MDQPSGSVPAPKPSPLSAVLQPGRVTSSAVGIGVFGAVLEVVQLVNALSHYSLNRFGIAPRSVHGLWGILAAPFLHTGWGHLLANLVPVVVLGFFVLVVSLRQFVAVTTLIWLISGAGVWLTARSDTVTVGASALAFGWLAFLVLRGVFTRRLTQLALGLVLLVIWGGIFWGVLPGRTGLSWQAHLFGALAGALSAFLVGRSGRQPAR